MPTYDPNSWPKTAAQVNAYLRSLGIAERIWRDADDSYYWVDGNAHAWRETYAFTDHVSVQTFAEWKSQRDYLVACHESGCD